MFIYVTSTGKLHITADGPIGISATQELRIEINSVARLIIPQVDQLFQDGFDFEALAIANNTNNDVNSGDLIRITDGQVYPFPYQSLYFENLRVWWTPTTTTTTTPTTTTTTTPTTTTTTTPTTTTIDPNLKVLWVSWV